MSDRSLVVEADGGSRGNPGVAGYGALVRDAASGRLLAERAEPLGKESNNVAEYRGLIAGLQAAARISPAADVAVRMDSKLVIEQMAGRWKIKHPTMRELASQAGQLVRERREAGGHISWTWIPRAQNKDADRLSNDGMDGKTVQRDPWLDDEPAGTDSASSSAAGAAEPLTDQADISRPARVILVRHGVTDFTTTSRLDGRGGSDPQLNGEGRTQAARAAAAIAQMVTGRVSVVTSSLRRAAQTGAAVADELGVGASVDDGWDELCYGAWDGLSLGEIERNDPGALARMRRDADFAPQQGETHRQLEARVQQAYLRAVDSAGPGGSVVVATHRLPIMTVLAGLLGLSMERAWMLDSDPASVSELKVWRDRHVSLSLLNQTTHLRG